MLILRKPCYNPKRKTRTLSMWPGIEERPSNWRSQSNVRSKLANIEISAIHFWGHLVLLVKS